MSLKSLEKRLRKLQKLKKLKELEPKVGPGKGDFTLLELCRASWNEDKERFKEEYRCTSLSAAIHFLETEDAMREHEQRMREERSSRLKGGLRG